MKTGPTFFVSVKLSVTHTFVSGLLLWDQEYMKIIRLGVIWNISKITELS